MPYTTFNVNKTIVLSLPKNDDDIFTFYQPNQTVIESSLSQNEQLVSLNVFFKNLKLYCDIQSSVAVGIPEFLPEDTETDKQLKVANIEWNANRKQLKALISVDDVWYPVGAIALTNSSIYPYRIYNLMDLFTDSLAIELGQNCKLGLQLEDVGAGLLELTDTCTLHGSITEEYVIYTPDIATFNNNFSPSNLRAIVKVVTNVLPANSEQEIFIPLPASFVLIKGEVNHPARVRLYSSQSARVNDASRAVTTQYLGSGLILENNHTATDLIIEQSPTVFGSILDSSSGIPALIQNKDSVARQITVTLTYIALEV